MYRFHYFFFTLILFCGLGVVPNHGAIAQVPHSVFRFDLDGNTVDMAAMLEASNTPALSMAIDNGQLDSSFTAAQPTTNDLTTESLFAAGAASALPVCIAVLQLVERGKLDLNAPINNYLKRGKLSGGESVSLKDVLLMKTRMGTGYKPNGYFEGKDLPSLESLTEEYRFRGMRKPDKGTEYGGWALLQLVLEQHYQEPLNTIIQREVFSPLCLEQMFYATELSPAQLKRVVMGHLESGAPIPGGYKRYVVQSDAGLWTNTRDYGKLVRALLDIKRGKEGGILLPETVKMAFAERYGHRSLLSHMSESGHPYWGGNAKGYYFTMQAHFSEDWVSVVAMNRDLNWRLGSPVVWQLGMLGKQWRADNRLGIVVQPGDSESELIAEIEHKAFVQAVKTERIIAEEGLPESISATPAFVFQSGAGRAIYGGKHNDPAAISKFILLNQATPRKFAAEKRKDVLGLRRGRQVIVLPLKLTAPTGNNSPSALPPMLVGGLQEYLVQKTDFEQMKEVSLSAQDRRIYLDVHSYWTEGDVYQMTYALFSQFNCHTPVKTSYGTPVDVTANGSGLELLATKIGADIEKIMQPELGLVPENVSANVPEIGWAELGWALDQKVAANQSVTSFTEPVVVNGTFIANLSKQDAPGLFFSFPSPLDRYSGEVRELLATFDFTDGGTKVSGKVDLPVASISTTSGSLDTYVLGDVLRSKKYPSANLTFSAVELTGNWQINEPVVLVVPAKLSIRGKTHDVAINAVFTPQASDELIIAADFSIDFKRVFGMNGPDGPENIRHQLDFTARFSVNRQNSK